MNCLKCSCCHSIFAPLVTLYHNMVNGMIDAYRKTMASDNFIGLYRGFIIIFCIGIFIYRGYFLASRTHSTHFPRGKCQHFCLLLFWVLCYSQRRICAYRVVSQVWLARLPQAQVPLIVPTSQALAMKADLVKNKPSTHSFTA